MEARKSFFLTAKRTELGVSILNGVCWMNSFSGERSITGRQPPEAFSTRKRRL